MGRHNRRHGDPVGEGGERGPSRVRAVVVALFAACLAYLSLSPCCQVREEPLPEAVPAAETSEGEGTSTGQVPASATVLPDDIAVTVPRACAERGTVVSWDENALGVRATWFLEARLVDAASGVLDEYRDAGTYGLVQSGYLDLLGNVWGCAVTSQSGWVELVFVDARDGGTYGSGTEEGGVGCVLTVVRLGQEAVER